MADFDIIVIGAGNAGLTAATALARKKKRVLLLERHNIPGGCATSFCRGRFEFEVSLHQLSGMGTPERPGPLRSVLDGLGVLDRLEFVEMKDLYRLTIPGQLDITLPPSREKVVALLQERFPREKEGIEKFFDLVYKFFTEIIGAFYMRDPEVSKEKYPLYFKYALKDSQSVIDQYLKDPLLQSVVTAYWGYMGLPPRLLPFSDLATMLFAYIEFKPGHLRGGSQMLSSAILDEYQANGGTARFNCPVKRVLIKNNRASGVVTEGGEEITGDYVISNASSITTYAEMMDGKNAAGEALNGMKGSNLGPSAVTLYIGLDCPPDKVGITGTTNFISPGADADKAYASMKRLSAEEDSLLLTCYNVVDPSFSPPGTTQAAIVSLKYGEPWLRVPPAEYAKTKYAVADQMLALCEKVFPGLRSRIEEMEIATPLTHMRYLGHPGGAIYGFDQHLKDSPLFVTPLSPVEGLYAAGSWVTSGGYQPTLTSGASVARVILKDMAKKEAAR